MVSADHCLIIIGRLTFIKSLTLASANQAANTSSLWPVSRKSRELFGRKKPVVAIQFPCVFFYVRKTKRIAKFDSLESRRCKEEEIVASEVGPRRFGKTDTRPKLLEAWIAL